MFRRPTHDDLQDLYLDVHGICSALMNRSDGDDPSLDQLAAVAVRLHVAAYRGRLRVRCVCCSRRFWRVRRYACRRCM